MCKTEVVASLLKTLNLKAMKTTNQKSGKIKRTILFLFVLFMFPFLRTVAQSSGEIHGRVLDSSTGESIPGAHVIIKAGTSVVAGTVSDVDGYFKMKPVPVGTHIVNISCVGFGEKEILSVQVDADKITFLREISMTYGTDLPTFTITWKGDLVDPENPSKKTMDMIVMKKIPGSSNFSDMLSAISSDIYSSEDRSEIHFRGLRANDAIYIVDGVKMINPSAMIPTRGIGNMTVYSGGVPAKYGDFTGGVIIVESDSYFNWLNREKSKQMAKSQ
jgi:hypothetical protein